MMSPRTAVFISGRGSNLQALLDMSECVRVSLVVSSQSEAWGVARARRHGVPVLVLPKKIDWIGLHRELISRGVQKIFLLGFMRLLPAEFVSLWSGSIWNIHPSLLPKFPGLHAIEKSFAAQEDMGVTVHEVNEGMDEGLKIYQAFSISRRALSSTIDLSRAQDLISRDEQRLVRIFGSRRLA